MLKKRFRLIKRGSFSYVYKNGSRVAQNEIKLAFVKSKGLRIGFSVGSKVGGAVKRNLVKRRMRHALASLIDRINTGYQMVFICGEGAYSLSYNQILQAVLSLLKRANALKPN